MGKMFYFVVLMCTMNQMLFLLFCFTEKVKTFSLCLTYTLKFEIESCAFGKN